VSWCPRLTQAIAQILYWKGIWKRTKGSHIWPKYLQHMANKGGLRHKNEHLQLDCKLMLTKIRKAYKHYLCLKGDKGRRETWLANLIEAQANAKNISKKLI